MPIASVIASRNRLAVGTGSMTTTSISLSAMLINQQKVPANTTGHLLFCREFSLIDLLRCRHFGHDRGVLAATSPSPSLHHRLSHLGMIFIVRSRLSRLPFSLLSSTERFCPNCLKVKEHWTTVKYLSPPSMTTVLVEWPMRPGIYRRIYRRKTNVMLLTIDCFWTSEDVTSWQSSNNCRSFNRFLLLRSSRSATTKILPLKDFVSSSSALLFAALTLTPSPSLTLFTTDTSKIFSDVERDWWQKRREEKHRRRSNTNISMWTRENSWTDEQSERSAIAMHSSPCSTECHVSGGRERSNRLRMHLFKVDKATRMVVCWASKMHRCDAQLMNLPDELLLIILTKLENVDVLYSLMGLNPRLDQIIRDSSFTTEINLIQPNADPCEQVDAFIHRFRLDILPKISHLVRRFKVQSTSMEHLLLAAHYPNLCQLDIFIPDEEPVLRFHGEWTLVFASVGSSLHGHIRWGWGCFSRSLRERFGSIWELRIQPRLMLSWWPDSKWSVGVPLDKRLNDSCHHTELISDTRQWRPSGTFASI